MATSRATWKNKEKWIAAAWTRVIGLLCVRNPLSGANNVTDKGERRGGDVIINADFKDDVLIEAKYRAKHAHHALYREAKADAKKHKKAHTLLYTSQKNEEGQLVIMDADLFHRLLEIKEVQEVFKKP